DRLAAAVRDVAVPAAEDGRTPDDLAEVWGVIGDLPGEVEGLNLDRGDAFFTPLKRLKAALALKMLIDTHVNLSPPKFHASREGVIERARAAGVGLMVTISDKLSTVAAPRAIAEAHPDIWFTVGTHPHEAREDPDLAPAQLEALAAHPKAVGIGETGLDFYYD